MPMQSFGIAKTPNLAFMFCLVRGDFVGPVGLEPTTCGLKVRSSTN